MRLCIIVTALLLLTTFSFGQVVDRRSDETPERFVSRFKPENSVITHHVIQTSWNLKPSIIAFFDQTYKVSTQKDADPQDYHRIIAVIFIKNKNQQYNKIIIDTIDTEGGSPKIESVFFANADKDANKELIIISSWKQLHHDVDGMLFGTLVYDDVSTKNKIHLSLLKNLSNRLSGGCECDWSNGTHKTAKFKTASEINKELKRLGYDSE
jgi:hypothetical protein